MGTPVGMSAVPEFMRLGGSATYEEAEISAVQFYYRWPSDNEKDPITQEPVVKEVRLNTTSEVNSESAPSCDCDSTRGWGGFYGSCP